MTTSIITIKPERDKPIHNRHPWVFSGAIASAQNARDGDLITIVSNSGEFLARGYWNSRSQIQARILSWHEEEIDEDWWRKMLQRAIGARIAHKLPGKAPLACRLINAENDYIPGLIVDRYGDFLVMQALTLYIDRNKSRIAAMLAEQLKANGNPVTGIYERSDVDVRKKEGLQPTVGLLWGSEPPELIKIQDDFDYYVDIKNGHKTGYYLDQAANHNLLYAHINRYFTTKPIHILNIFSYTGGFGLSALRSPLARVTNVDSSREALELAEKNIRLNGHNTARSYECVQADAFDYLRYCEDENLKFHLIILDPPKFARNRQQVERASRGYKDLNLRAFKILHSGGYLMTFSCSGAIDPDLFQKIVFGALIDSGKHAQIMRRLEANSDHPVALTFPEGAYLKGLLLRVY